MSNYMKELPETAKAIPNTMCWVDMQGNLYGIETRTIPNRWNGNRAKHKHYGEYFRYHMTVNNRNGYVYAPVKYILPDGKSEVRQRRVHILVAEAFLPNPFNLPVVGHKNNIKTDNTVANLYWTTFQENTRKAVDDGLLVNDKGYEDSQSQPVVMFDVCTLQELGRYGSIKEAERETGIAANTIARQCKYKKPVRKPYFFRFQSEEYITPPRKVVQFDYHTDEQIAVYYNTKDAENKTGILAKVISQQCANGWKPKTATKSRTYFQYQ